VSRRSPAEVRQLLLAAAERTTAREGRAVSLAAISAEAGVSRSAMYRHFASRDELLTEAALAPFVQFVDEFRSVALTQIRARDSVWEMERAFVGALLDHFSRHRQFIASVLSDGSVLDRKTRENLYQRIDQVIDEITGVAVQLGEALDMPAEHIGTWVRMVIALASGVSANESWLLPRGAAAWSRRQLIDNLTTFILYGIQRPPSSSPSRH
jgi:AcrR family transcriptional regulator